MEPRARMGLDHRRVAVQRLRLREHRRRVDAQVVSAPRGNVAEVDGVGRVLARELVGQRRPVRAVHPAADEDLVNAPPWSVPWPFS